MISDRLIYGRPAETVAPRPERPTVEPVRHLVDAAADGSTVDRARAKRIRYLPYRYDVAGMVTIGRQMPLPELEFFRAQWLGRATWTSRSGSVTSAAGHPAGPRCVTQYVDPTALRYEEHLGRLGANFRIDLGRPIQVDGRAAAGPVAARRLHEHHRGAAALRGRPTAAGCCCTRPAWSSTATGSCCRARTDTGKTGTVLRLLREQGGAVPVRRHDDRRRRRRRRAGFPKPLTISHHTLRAVEASDLTPGGVAPPAVAEPAALQGGPLARHWSSARYNLPIMGDQRASRRSLVPPPKYSVDRLVPCRTHRRRRCATCSSSSAAPDALSDVSTRAGASTS